jgi:hypothetical protein
MTSQAPPLPSSTTQEAAPGCTGAVTVYNSSGLVVPFKNLCGKDISAPVDFMEPYFEASFADCMARCVEKKPLCYGFDFRPLGSAETNCWLKNAAFDERTAVSRDFVSDAAMLGPDVLRSVADECKESGLLGCFQKNGGWKQDPTAGTTSLSSAVSSASSSVSMITSSTTATSSTVPVSKDGLSTGASAGIGVGVGLVVLGAVLVGILFLLRRRKQKARNISGGAVEAGPGESATGYKYVQEKSVAPAELYAQPSYHDAIELESPGSQAQPVVSGVAK